MEETKEEAPDQKIKPRKLIKCFQELWFLVSGYRRKLPLFFFFIVLQSFTAILGIGLIIPFVTLIQNSSYLDLSLDITTLSQTKQVIIQGMRYMYTTFGFSSPLWYIVFLGALFVFFSISRVLGTVFIEYKICIYSNQAANLVCRKMFTSHLFMSYTYYLGRNIAENVYFTSLVNQHFAGTVNSVLLLFSDVLFVVFLLAGFLFWNPYVILIAVMILGICWLIHHFMRAVYSKTVKSMEDVTRGFQKTVFKSFSQFVFAKLYNLERRFAQHLDKILSNKVRLSARLILLQSPYRVVIETIGVTLFMIYVIYTYRYQPSLLEDAFTSFVVFATALVRLIPSILRILGSMHAVVVQEENIHVIYNEYVHALKNKEIEESRAKRLKFTHSLELKDVHYTYPKYNADTQTFEFTEKNKVVKNLSISIKKGQRVGIVGESGGGKSTLCNILMGFLLPQKGSIFVDGKDIAAHVREWRKNIGYVPQDITFFNESLLSNITFDEDKDEDKGKKGRVKKAEGILKKLKLYTLVQQLPQGIDTNIGDFGKNLSGGQRQRVGLARALYRDPDVLILDEATSHLDTKTEQEVQKAIDTISAEKTIVIVAHRTHTLANCDVIYSLSNGKINFEGTYKQLLAFQKKETHKRVAKNG